MPRPSGRNSHQAQPGSQERRISRRTVLLAGTAGLALAPAHFLSRAVQPGSPPRSAGRGARVEAGTTPIQWPPPRVGGTLSLQTFPQGTSWEQAVQDWNQQTGTTMQCWKIYYQEGDFGAGNDDRIQAIVKYGIKALVSVKPSRSLSPTQRQGLSSLLKHFKQDLELEAEVCLWQEVDANVMSASQYHDYVKYYGPTVQQYYPLVFDAPGHVDPEVWSAYAQGLDFDGYAVDYYGSVFLKNGQTLEKMAAIAGSHPVGLWEIGNTLSTAHPLPSKAQVQDYLTYITDFLTQRAAQHLPVGSVAWYNAATDSTLNEVVGKDKQQNPWLDIDLQKYLQLWFDLNSVTATS